MSEAIGRRLVLQGGLAAMAGGLLYGCGGVPVVLAEPAPRHAALTAALKDVLCAQYDQLLLKRREFLDKLPVPEKNKPKIAQFWKDAQARVAAGVPRERRLALEDCVREAGLPASVLSDIEDFKDCDALESYYDINGLKFHRDEASAMPGYELLRLSPAKPQTVMLLGAERKVCVQSIEEVLIPHSSQYAAAQSLPAHVLAGQYWTTTKSVVMRPGVLQMMTDVIYEMYETEMLPEGDALFDPKRLEKHIYSVPLPTDFWMNLGRQLRCQSIQGESGDKKKALHEAFGQNIFLHEVMHAVDDEDFGFIKESKYAQELVAIKRSNAELRAYLASMIEGHSRHALTDTLRAAVFGVQKEAHTVAAMNFIDRMVAHVVKNPKKYPEIDLSKGLAADLLRQLPKLSDGQIKQMATGVFEAVYRGRSLREYVLDFTK